MTGLLYRVFLWECWGWVGDFLNARECRQISLVQRTIARIWQMARKEAEFLA